MRQGDETNRRSYVAAPFGNMILNVPFVHRERRRYSFLVRLLYSTRSAIAYTLSESVRIYVRPKSFYPLLFSCPHFSVPLCVGIRSTVRTKNASVSLSKEGLFRGKQIFSKKAPFFVFSPFSSLSPSLPDFDFSNRIEGRIWARTTRLSRLG